MNEKQLEIEFRKKFARRSNNASIGTCFYPIPNDCSSKIIKAHSIQRGGILTEIAVNGMVYTYNFIKYILSNELRKVGIKQATTFKGFCSHHDQIIFRPVETTPYVKTNEQNFLLAYRAFACEYYKKFLTNNIYRDLSKEYGNLNQFLLSQVFFSNVAIKELTEYKRIFDAVIMKERKIGDLFHSIVFEVDYPSLFAVNSTFNLKMDYNETQINSLSQLTSLKPLFLNIFPQNGKTYIVFTLIKDYISIYVDFFKYLRRCNQDELTDKISRIVLNYCENMVLNPVMWDNIPESNKQAFLMEFTKTMGINQENIQVPSPIDLFRLFKKTI